MFLVSGINHFFSYKSCLEIQTAMLAINLFTYFGTTGFKSDLLIKTELDANSACSPRRGVCAHPKLRMRSLSEAYPDPVAGSWSACGHAATCRLLLQPPPDGQCCSSSHVHPAQAGSEGPGVPGRRGLGGLGRAGE